MRVPAVTLLIFGLLVSIAGAGESDEWKDYLVRHPEPGPCHALVKAGLVGAAEGKLAEALASLEKAEKQGCGAGDGLVLARMAFLHRLAKRPEQSLAYYEKALPKLEEQYSENPAWVLALYNTGYLHEQGGRTQKALEFYRAALERDPGFHNARTSLRGLLQRTAEQALESGDGARAVEFAAQALAVQDEIDRGLTSKDIKGRLGVTMVALRAAVATRNGKAAKGFHDQLLTDGDAAISLKVARVWDRAGMPGPAALAYQRAAELDPKDVNALMALGELREGEERWKDAAAAYEQAGLRRPRNVDILYALGYAHFSGGDYESAKQAFKKALEIDPSHAGAKDALGQLGGN